MSSLYAVFGKAVVISVLVACPAAVADEKEGGDEREAAERYPWESDAFAADPQDVLQAAQKLSPPLGAAVHEYLDEVVCRIDAQGRRELRRRSVWRILNRQGLNDAVVAAAWSPWLHHRPQLDARVIGPDGSIQRLDPSTINEVPFPQSNPTVFSDKRVLQAPIPALRVGAIVEYRTVVRERVPFFGLSGVTHVGLYTGSPNVLLLRRRLTAPLSFGLKYDVFGTDLKPTREQTDEQIVVSVERRQPPPVTQVDSDLPADVVALPYLVASGKSTWNEIATKYAKLVDDKLAGAELKESAEGLANGAATPAEQVQRVLAHVRQQVRYTGIEFGEEAIIPHTPSQTLTRGYGDCKDQSTLLVGMLRSIGIEANVALINAAALHGTSPDHPGLDAFDHVIVFLPKLNLWLDPTAGFHRPGQLPVHLQGKMALVADAATQQLTKTPVATSADSVMEESFEYRFAHDGSSTVKHIVQVRGTIGAAFRSQISQFASPQQFRQSFLQQVKQSYGSDKLTEFSVSDVHDFQTPFRRESVVADAVVGTLNNEELIAPIYGEIAFDYLPFYLRATPQLAQVPQFQRKTAVSLSHKYQYVGRWRLVPPSGFRVAELPAEFSFQIGSFEFRQAFRQVANEVVEVEVRFDCGDGQLTVPQVAEFQAKFQQLRREGADPLGIGGGQVDDTPTSVRFVHRGQELIDQGKHREGFAVFLASIAAQPNELAPREIYVRALHRNNVSWEAQRQAKEMVRTAPDSEKSQRLLGLMLTFDAFGRQYQHGYDMQGARQALRRAVELAPEDFLSRWFLAEALTYDEYGNSFPQSTLAEAIQHYRKADQLKPPNAGSLERFYHALFIQGDDAALQQQLQNVPPTVTTLALQLAVAAKTDPAGALNYILRSWPQAENQRVMVINTMNLLNNSRHYEAAAKWLDTLPETLRDPQIRVQQNVLRKLKKFEDARFEEADPRQVAQDVVRACLMNVPGEAILRQYGVRESKWGAKRLIAVTSSLFNTATPQHLATALRRGDAVSAFEVEHESVAEGRVTRVRFSHNGQTAALFVLKTEDGYRLLPDDFTCPETGSIAFQLATAGDTEAAEKILQWIYEETKQPVSLFLPFSGTPFQRTWPHRQRQDKGAVQLAAAMLAGTSSRPEKPIQFLREARAAETESLVRLQIERALLDAYRDSEDYEAALKLTEDLLDSATANLEVRRYQLFFLLQLDRADEARQQAEAAVEGETPATWALAVLSDLAARNGDFSEAMRWGRKALDNGLKHQPTRADLLNAIAWQALLVEDVPQDAVQWAAESVELNASSEALHTQATVAAVHGEPNQVIQLHSEAISLRADPALQPYDWFTLFLMAERFGLEDAAKHAYQRYVDSRQGDEWQSLQPAFERRLAKMAGP